MGLILTVLHSTAMVEQQPPGSLVERIEYYLKRYPSCEVQLSVACRKLIPAQFESSRWILQNEKLQWLLDTHRCLKLSG
jgi:hypothetical protein